MNGYGEASAVGLTAVTKLWGRTRVLDDVTHVFPAGTTTAIRGVSGSGKSTLLNLIAGYVTPDSGTVQTVGRTSYLLQAPLLFDNLRALDNLRIATGATGARHDDELIGHLRTVGLASREHQLVERMSGGERQRVLFAGILATDAEIVLIDEPTSSLDRATSIELAATANEIFTDRTLIIATHDDDFVARLDGARVVTLEKGKLHG